MSNSIKKNVIKSIESVEIVKTTNGDVHATKYTSLYEFDSTVVPAG